MEISIFDVENLVKRYSKKVLDDEGEFLMNQIALEVRNEFDPLRSLPELVKKITMMVNKNETLIKAMPEWHMIFAINLLVQIIESDFRQLAERNVIIRYGTRFPSFASGHFPRELPFQFGYEAVEAIKISNRVILKEGELLKYFIEYMIKNIEAQLPKEEPTSQIASEKDREDEETDAEASDETKSEGSEYADAGSEAQN